MKNNIKYLTIILLFSAIAFNAHGMATFFAIKEKVSNFFGEQTYAQKMYDKARDILLKKRYNRRDPFGNTPAHTCAGDKAIKPSSTMIAYCSDAKSRKAYIEDIEKQNRNRAAEQKEIIKKMAEFNLDLNAKNNEGDTPLAIAAANGNDFVVDCLLEGKADINITDSNGKTPLQLAQQYKREYIAQKIKDLSKKDTSEAKKDII